MAVKKAPKKAVISKSMTFADILDRCPQAGRIMMKYGLHCIGCHIAHFETLEQGCAAHGMSKENMEKMLKEIQSEVK